MENKQKFKIIITPLLSDETNKICNCNIDCDMDKSSDLYNKDDFWTLAWGIIENFDWSRESKEIKNQRLKKLLENEKCKELMKLPEMINIYYWGTNLSLENLIEIVNVESKFQVFNAIKSIVNNTTLIKRNCKECGKEINLIPTGRSDRDRLLNIYCICDSCREKRKNNTKNDFTIKSQEKIKKYMPYKEYLQTDHWKEIRKEALKKANYKCELCNGTHKLNVHHKTYENKGNEKPEDLIVLCHDCHAKFHDKLDNEDDNNNNIENNTYIIPNNDTEILNQLLNTLHISKEELLIYIKCKEKLNSITF